MESESPRRLRLLPFSASIYSTETLMSRVLPWPVDLLSISSVSRALDSWKTSSDSAPPPCGPNALRQRSWDDCVSRAITENLLLQADTSDRARLLAAAAPGAGAWLQALPSQNLGLRLGDQEIRIAAGLRLGVPLVRPHPCVCGSLVDSLGHHGLSCRFSAGRHRRHALANDVILRAVRAVQVHAELEPTRLSRNDDKRPDGATLDPWCSGQYLVWDFTCPDTLAPSRISNLAQTA